VAIVIPALTELMNTW